MDFTQKELKKQKWEPVKERLLHRLSDQFGDDVKKMAVELLGSGYEYKRQLSRWLDNTTPNWDTIDELESLLDGKARKSDDSHTPNHSVVRKAEIVANHLESAVPLMEWFINQASEEQRDLFRTTLGTDLSYDSFNACRALLTEDHHKKVMEEKG